MNIPVGLQLFTVREELEKDFIGTLEKVAKLGYKGVEFAGYGNLTSKELRAELDRLGLKATSSHVSLELLKNDIDGMIKYNLEIGSKYIICPWAKFETKEEALELVEILKAAGEKCKAAGIGFGYHNHNHEFIDIDGEYGLDFLYSHTEPDSLQAEIDTYWVKRAGLDPIQYIKKYTGRCPLLHIKDMEDSEEKAFAEIGCGIIDIEGIAKTAKDMKVEWLIVEQDKCKRPPMESIAISIENLKKMGLA